MPETSAAAGPLREADVLVAAAEAPWLPAMAGMLARSRWELLKQQSGLSETNYGTARVLAGNADAPKTVAAEFVLPAAFGRPEPILVETLPFVVAYSRLGLRLAQSVPPSTSNRLLEGFGAIARIGGLARAVGGVLAVVHVLDVPSPNHDVSFSDPAVPFSVFVGVHRMPVSNDALRMAEQLVHECMHLQLTLLEAIHPLVSGNVEKHWSPWQETMRPTRGVLHGLYVFSVLDAFFAELARLRHLTVGEAEHLAIRRREIEAEIGQAADALAGSVELTTFGRAFITALLAPGKAVAVT